MDRFNFNEIDEYQIEITSFCNASCPQCPRNLNGSEVNPFMPLVHLPLDVIKSTFKPAYVKKLRQVFWCGSYGDPIMHPQFLEILQYFRDCSDSLWLYIHTNGGVHGPEYWSDMAKIIGTQGKIDFGIDGLEDTNHLYRQNVKFNKVIENAKAFIDAGGNAQWNFIVFEHNEHQVDEAKSISELLGFKSFVYRTTGRFFNHTTISEMDEWPSLDKKGNMTHVLRPPKNEKYRNKSMLFLPVLRKEYDENMKDYFNTTDITCDALLGKKVIISAEGLVLPCNFFTHNLYDARFNDSSILPGANPLSFINGQNQVQTLVNRYKEHLNINNNSLEEIFKLSFWDEIISSWGKPLNEGRIFECAMTCGSKIQKVWDQSKDNLKR
jgi:MoaA/NifB/PqqE/SkfB family radical SAM enzyme